MESTSDWFLGIITVVFVYLIGIYYTVIEFVHDNFRSSVSRFPDKQRDQLKRTIFYKSLKDPTAIVTGGSGIIGCELVKQLLQLGFKVVSISGNEGRLAGFEDEHLEQHTLSLTDLPAVKRLSADIVKSNRAVNLIICNAGVMLRPNEPDIYGHEPHMALHLLAHAALIHYLTPAVRRAEGCCRILFVSSSTALAGHLDENIVHKPELFSRYINGYFAYATSKLATSIYAERLDCFYDERVEANSKPLARVSSCHPGCVSGPLYANTFWLARVFINNVLAPFSRKASIAALELLSTVLSDEFEGGMYYERMQRIHLRSDVSNEVKEKLFERVCRFLRLES